MSASAKKRQGSARLERRRLEQQRARTRRLSLLGAVALIAILIAGTLIYVSQRGDDESSGLPAVVAAAPLDAAIPSDGRVLGNPDAPVTLTEWADYQCPYCEEFNQQFMPRLIADYVTAGKLKIEFRDLPFLDDRSGSGESDRAAEAVACAADQGKFWLMHDTLFANQHGENEGAFSKSRVQEMAELIGLDTTQFNSCLDDGTHESEIAAMTTEAGQLGVNSTPSLFLNGAQIDFTGKYEDLKAEIDAALAG